MSMCLGSYKLILYLPFQAPWFPFLLQEGRAVPSAVLRYNHGHRPVISGDSPVILCPRCCIPT